MTVEFVDHHGRSLGHFLVRASAQKADGLWVRPDGVPFRNQAVAGTNSAYRRAVEQALAWRDVADPELVDVESSPTDVGWIDPRGRTWPPGDPGENTRAIADMLILSETIPPTRAEFDEVTIVDALARATAQQGSATLSPRPGGPLNNARSNDS